MTTKLTRVIVTSFFVAVFTVGAGFINTNSALADSAVLGVTQISAVQTFATADNTFANGWKWVFDVTVPTNETVLNMKFADWASTLGNIPAGSNIQIYSSQSLNAFDNNHAITLTAAGAYSDPMYLLPSSNPNSDLDSTKAGKQIQITVEARVPAGSAGASYSTSYGIQSNPETTAPVITLVGDPTVTVEVGSSYTDTGATALDNVDGNLTSNIALTGSVDTSIVGTYTLTYNVSNSAAVAATPVTRKINVVDTTKPSITAPHDVTAEATGKHTAVDLGTPTVTDIGDSSPKVTNDAPTTFPLGDTTVTWTATDVSGNTASAAQKITVTDTTKPVITLDGPATVAIPVFGTYTEAGANVTDNYDSGLTATITGTVDTNNVGTYTLHYNVTDSSGNVADEVTRTVSVSEHPITVTVDSQSKVYGTDDPALTYKITDGSLNPGDSFTGSLTREAGDNVGTYAITQGNLSLSSNYTLNVIPLSFTITPAKAEVVIGSLEQTYDGTAKPVTVTTSPEGVATTVTYNGSVTVPSDAGTYAVIATVTDPNYTGTANGTLTVKKAVATVSATGGDKTYDGTVTPGNSFTLNVNGAVSGDSLTATGDASFTDKNVDLNKTINVTGIALIGTHAADYEFNDTATTQASIMSKSLTVTATGVDKQYNHSTHADVELSSADIVSGNAVTISGSASFADDSNVGQNKDVSVTGISISGTDAGNYLLQGTSANTTANITQAPLTIDGMKANNRVYNGTSVATLNGTPILGGVVKVGSVSDIVSIDTAGVSASFTDKNVGDSKSVTVTGYAITGDDAKNYSLTQPIGLTANITPLGITGSITANNKVYDGSKDATILTRPLAGAIAGDDVTYTGGTATFADKKVGDGKEVTATGLSLSGTDAGNYTVNDKATTNANITPKDLTVTATIGDKVYDGTNSIDDGTVIFKTDVLNGDVVSVPTGFGYTLINHNVGTQQVVVKGITIAGSDAGNYSLTNTSADTTVNITSKPLTVSGLTAVSKTYDGTTDATLSGTAELSGVVTGETVNLTGTPIAVFASPNAGTEVVNVTGYTIDNSNYSLVQSILSATISKATPDVTWATPSDINDTDSLTGTQLDATASVGGTFVYTPAEGTKLPVGQNTLSTEFTPEDSVNYTSVTKTVTINVKDTTPPTFTVTGFTANDTPMAGDVTNGYTLNTDGNAKTHYAIQFTTGSVASEALKVENVALTLQPTGNQITDLQNFYATNYPPEYQTYLDGAAAGTQPFAYIKTDGTSIKILDGAMETLAHTETDMSVPGDYPAGTYTVSGTIHDLAGNSTTVTYVLKVVPVITLSSIAITTLPKTAYTVGDDLDLTDLVVTGTYSDNSTKVETVNASNITGFDKSTAGTQTLTVTVDGKTATFNVTVTAKPVPVVKTDLETAIELANAKVEIDYTVDSWSAMQTALTAAQNVDTNASAIQTEVDTAMTGLNTAINGLVSVTPAS